MNSEKPSEKTLSLLLEHEVGGGKAYYDKFLSKFTWPQGQSGPTIGIGIDCAYYTAEELKKIFYFLPESQIKLIQGAVGKTGVAGQNYTEVLKKAGIIVSWDQALEIFYKLTWTKFTKLAEKTFPGLDQLHPDAYGAIVSIVFNRGTDLAGPRRVEMANIKKLIPSKDYKQIAAEIRKMKRLWLNTGQGGLLRRREDEAKLVESVIV